MSISYEEYLHLALIADGDQSHGDAARLNVKALARVLAPTDKFFVSPGYTAARLGNNTATDRRHFPTIQEAITRAQDVHYDHLAIVEVEPGVYNENLVISNSVTVFSKVPPIREGLGGGAGVRINGTSGNAEPVVVINPPGSTPTAVNFINLSMSNAYNVANSSEIAEAYLLKVTKPATYTERLHLGIKNVQARMQTYGDDNLWSYGIKVEGWVQMAMRNTDIAGFGYAGGEKTGGVRFLVWLEGDHDNGHGLTFGGKDLNLSNEFNGSGTTNVFVIDKGVTGSVGRSNFPAENEVALCLVGNTGENQIDGLTGSTIAEYMNTQGLNLAWF